MKLFRLVISLFLLSAAASSFAANALFIETADKVRFEQFTAGENTALALYRLPIPNSSTFPLDSNGTPGPCTQLYLPLNNTTLGNRFLSLYMFVKTNASTYFIQYDTSSCAILSFGMDG
jgi:hypothetical protein